MEITREEIHHLLFALDVMEVNKPDLVNDKFKELRKKLTTWITTNA